MEFEVALGSKVLDLSILSGLKTVFIEVVAADTSVAAQDAVQLLKQVSAELIKHTHGVLTEVLLDANFSLEQLPDLVAAVQDIDELGVEAVISDLASLVKQRPSTPINASPPPLDIDIGKVRLAIAQVETKSDIVTATIVRIPVSDERASRFLSERHHFSRERANILVVNTSAVIGGRNSWADLLRKQLTPTRNTRFGAILLFDESLSGTPLRSRASFEVVTNPYSRVPLSDAALEALERLKTN